MSRLVVEVVKGLLLLAVMALGVWVVLEEHRAAAACAEKGGVYYNKYGTGQCVRAETIR